MSFAHKIYESLLDFGAVDVDKLKLVLSAQLVLELYCTVGDGSLNISDGLLFND